MKTLLKLRIIFLLFFLSPLLLFSQITAENYRKSFEDRSAIATQVQAKLEALATDPSFKIAGEKYHNIEYVTNLYEKNNYQPFWTEISYAEDAINGIRQSFEDGLNPPDYHLDMILELMNSLASRPKIGEELVNKVTELELLLTDGVIFFADHLLYGKCDPVTLLKTWNYGFAPIPEVNPTSFRHYIETGEITSRLREMRPDIYLYDTLVSILAFYREINTKGGWQEITAGGKIEPGDRDDRLPQIRYRLQLTHELSVKDTTGNTFYDKNLEQDIRRFQRTHGLDADGVIGAGTFRELSKSVQERIETIRVNMERVRWVAGNLPESYLIVNIAAYWLVLVNDGRIIHKTNVVVGKPLNKTPVFRDKIRYIDFNPTWTVPTSIIKNEIIPKLKKNPQYLEENHMVLLDNQGNEVSSSVLDIENLSMSKFPYMVRQQPGPWNALGVVKFMFPNDHDIYLHDTPSKSLFSKTSRAYSHGCIRVQNPLDLAEVLLTGTEWTRAKINKVIETRELTRVKLPEPVNIMLSYWTCGLNPDREFFFSPDPYDKDNDLLRELNKTMH
jgi:murein L,D-transpeptidase YcbB/YkuD